jgi:hypothetical protein
MPDQEILSGKAICVILIPDVFNVGRPETGYYLLM